MPYDLKQLPGESILISTLLSPFDVENDLQAIGEATQDFLRKTPGTFYFITDTTQLDQITFGQVVFGLVAVTRGAASFLLRDERIKPFFVATSMLARLATDSLKQKQYGGLNFHVFRSIDDALAYIRNDIAAN